VGGGSLRAVGLRRACVFLELLKQSILIGTAGTAVGVPLGVALAVYGLPVAARTCAIAFRLPVVSARVAARAEVLVLGAVVGLLAAVAAAVVPALRLARTRPVAALSMRARESDPPLPALGIIVVVVLLATSGVLTAVQQMWRVRSFGIITTVLVAVACCGSASLVVQRAAGPLTVLWRCTFGPTGEFAAGHLGAEPRRASLIVATLGIGLGAVLLLGLLGSSFEYSLVSQLVRSFQADLIVFSAFAGAGYRGAPMSDTLVDELRATPGIDTVCGEQSVDVLYDGGAVVLKTYDGVCFRDPRAHRFPLEPDAMRDPLGLLERGEGVLVSGAFADQQRIRPGDTIALSSPTGQHVLPVAGGARQPENAITIVRERYREWWDDSFVVLAHIVVRAGVDGRAAGREIRRKLGERYRIKIYSSSALVNYFTGQEAGVLSLQYTLDVVAFLLVLVGIGDTLATGVSDRTRELGMMRAVGLRRRGLRAVVMLEGGGIAVLGLMLAGAAGVVLGVVWVQFPALMGWKPDFHIPVLFAVTVAALTVLLCLAGSLLPSLRAARLSLPDALRHE
jgi:putative ABC transport system permease protein